MGVKTVPVSFDEQMFVSGQNDQEIHKNTTSTAVMYMCESIMFWGSVADVERGNNSPLEGKKSLYYVP